MSKIGWGEGDVSGEVGSVGAGGSVGAIWGEDPAIAIANVAGLFDGTGGEVGLGGIEGFLEAFWGGESFVGVGDGFCGCGKGLRVGVVEEVEEGADALFLLGTGKGQAHNFDGMGEGFFVHESPRMNF